MPISYSCPHCGKQFSVADQYAGQTGPCAACGQSITIPMAAFPGPGMGVPPAGYYQPKPTSGGGASLAVIIIAVVLVLLLIPGVLVALLIPAVASARGAARRSQSMNNMKQIALAMHNYHDVHGALPPAVVTDASGKPLYSGRVLLLPYLEQAYIYDQWDKTQAWDSNANRALSQMIIPTFHDPTDIGAPGQTSYVFPVGQGTIFEQGQKVTFNNIMDGTSNTLMLVEVKGSGINWAEPRDLDVMSGNPLPLGNHNSGNIIGLADGSVRTLPPNTPATTIQAAASRAGGEPVMLP
jgi:type II secretory pathway pseudopilin PulG